MTQLQVKNAKPKDKAYKLAAGGGLYLEVTPTGSKLWRMKYRQASGKENKLHAIRLALREGNVIRGADYKKEHLDDPKVTHSQQLHLRSLSQHQVDRVTALRDYKALGINRDETLSVVRYDFERHVLVLERDGGGTAPTKAATTRTGYSAECWKAAILRTTGVSWWPKRRPRGSGCNGSRRIFHTEPWVLALGRCEKWL